MEKAKKFEFTYHSGELDGIISIIDRRSPMAAYVIPRRLLAEAKEIKEIYRPGIYYLIGEGDEGKVAQIYIGHTTQGIVRIENHDRNRNKDFWNKAILFLAPETSFDSTTIERLEKYAIDEARALKLYIMENANTPQCEIDKYMRYFIGEWYKDIQFIMESLGYRMSARAMNGKKIEAGEVFYASRKGRGIKAYGTYDGQFHVLEGSEVDFEKPAKTQENENLRNELLEKGDIVQEGGKYILKKSIPFDTPSAASVFVFGYNTNGRKEWKREDGKTLGEVYGRK